MPPTGDIYLVILIVAFIVVIVSAIIMIVTRYQRCPSDMILVIYGKVGEGKSARCIHGGSAMVWPLFQDYRFISLTPMTIAIALKNALSKQNIRIDVPSTFTVGVSTNPSVMTNAAERLLGLSSRDIEQMAGEIIFGQLRLTIASLTIEEINQDRERFLEAIRQNVEPELNKIGLYLINVNVTDITDESDYIQSIGQKAAATAINQAKIDVAEQVKLGAIGQAVADKEKEIKVAENQASSVKGIKRAESERRIYVQQQEAEAIKGEKQAVAEQRIYVEQQEAEAIKGENLAKAHIADSDAALAVKRAEAQQLGEIAKRKAQAEIQKAEYLAEAERLKAEKIAKQEIDKQMIEIAADAEAEKRRREAKGEADAVLMKYQAEAEGIRKVLEGKAEGYRTLVESCHGDARAAATLLMVEKIEEIVGKQVEAIKNLKIDKITVWDSGTGSGNGDSSSTANFLSNFIKSLPPLQEVSKMAGVELPEFLGKMGEIDKIADVKEKENPTDGIS